MGEKLKKVKILGAEKCDCEINSFDNKPNHTPHEMCLHYKCCIPSGKIILSVQVLYMYYFSNSLVPIFSSVLYRRMFCSNTTEYSDSFTVSQQCDSASYKYSCCFHLKDTGEGKYLPSSAKLE